MTGFAAERWWLETPGDFTRALAAAGSNSETLVSDLSIGACRPHQLWREWSAALKLPQHAGAVRQRPVRFEYAALIAAGIDSEAAGSLPILAAGGFARQLVRALDSRPTSLVVIAPFDDEHWGLENLWLLRFLDQNLRGSSSRLVVLHAKPEVPLPPGIDGADFIWLYPGAVPVTLADRILPGNGEASAAHVLLNPVLRRACVEGSRQRFDQLNSAARSDLWLKAHAQARGNPTFFSLQVAVEAAWTAFHEGSPDLSLGYLETAVARSSGSARAEVVAQLQGLRIGLRRYGEASQESFDLAEAPTRLQPFLLQARGWGCVMDRKPAQALSLLQRAAQEPMGSHEEKCYLWNILALAHAQCGNEAEALALEGQVEELAGRGAQPQLQYVNQLNTARLLRRRGDHSQARHHYARAFAVFDGLKTPFEHVYENATLARLAEEAGHPAGHWWVRCAFGFLALDVPEAISTRYLGPILRDAVSAEVNVGAVAGALAGHLERSGIRPTRTSTKLDFTTDETRLGPCRRVAGMSGWVVAAGQRRQVPGSGAPTTRGPEIDRLSDTLSSLVVHALGPAHFPCDTVYLDDRFGRAMPADLSGGMALALRLAADAVVFETRLEPATEDAASMLAASVLRRSPALLRLESTPRGGAAVFRARRAPILLDEDDFALVSTLEEPLALCDAIRRGTTTLLRVRRLEAQHLVCLDPA